MTTQATLAPLQVGAAKRDITCLIPGMAMMGWAMHFNTAESIESPLYARAVYFADPNTGRVVAYVHCDIAFITCYIRKHVLHRLATEHPELGLGEDNLMLTANHTHSAPGGISEYFLYNVMIAGFSFYNTQRIIDGIVAALVAAAARKRPATLHTAKGSFPEDIPVAFNRAWEAHSANDDVTETFTQDSWHLAVDREMTLLRVEGTDGLPIAMLNWFAVHTTSVHSDKHTISPDNKGYAARVVEEKMNDEYPTGDFIAVFAQACTGDVTPNFMRHPGLKEMRGASPDDYESMRINGGFQAELARKLFAEALLAPAAEPRLDGAVAYHDMTRIALEPEFARGRKGQHTGDGMLGIGFMKGTREGEGVHGLIPWFAEQVIEAKKLYKPATHGPCKPVINCTQRTILGNPIDELPVPDFLSPEVKAIQHWAKHKAIGDKPLTPNILPIQILQLGDLAIAGLPNEPTTQVGRRLRATLAPILADCGVKTVVAKGYTNAYSGYVTTYEEYLLQGYEASSTHFGMWTEGAYRQLFRDLALQFTLSPDNRTHDTGLRPHAFTEEELRKRKYIPKKQYGFAATPVNYTVEKD